MRIRSLRAKAKTFGRRTCKPSSGMSRRGVFMRVKRRQWMSTPCPFRDTTCWLAAPTTGIRCKRRADVPGDADFCASKVMLRQAYRKRRVDDNARTPAERRSAARAARECDRRDRRIRSSNGSTPFCDEIRAPWFFLPRLSGP